MQKKYTPRPLDTSDVIIPESLDEIAEAMAKNVHEVWSQGRIDDGWTYGDTRDDENKKHPCLIPYEELSEREKDFDRHTSQETIKFLLKSGYLIIKDK